MNNAPTTTAQTVTKNQDLVTLSAAGIFFCRRLQSREGNHNSVFFEAFLEDTRVSFHSSAVYGWAREQYPAL